MSPFLAEVNVFNVSAGGEVSARPSPNADAHAQMAAAVQQLKAATEQLKNDSRATAEAAVKKAKEAVEEARARLQEQSAKTGDNDDDEDAHDATPRAEASATPKHHKSSSDEVPFAVFPITTVTLVFLYLIVRALMAPFTNRGKRNSQMVVAGLTAEESATLDKLQRTLAQMESRVESLETILIDQSRTKEKYGTKL